jgi:hypothetical protein
MPIIRPRLTDYYGILLSQSQVDFAIPFIDEDIPLYVDPFLLWRSPSQQDQALHTSLINSFNHLAVLVTRGKEQEAIELLVAQSECEEVGLGLSRTRQGRRIGPETAGNILALFKDIPQYRNSGFEHFEEIQFFVTSISKDRISDFACSFLKSFLIDYTIQQCSILGVPTSNVSLDVYSYSDHRLKSEKLSLPVNPETGAPIIFVPKRWLRFTPWLNLDEYFAESCPRDQLSSIPASEQRAFVVTYNREHYGSVFGYIESKERLRENCKNDPLFTQIPITSAKASLSAIKQLATGTGEANDKTYERELARLLASALYPQLDFAKSQARTDSGVLIRDLIFYNNRSHPLLEEIFEKYDSRQIVMEMKNVRQIEREHINQLNRYLTEQFGRFGVLLTRNPLPKAMFKSTIDLWSGQRRCIIALTDQDLDLMVSVFESKQRDPIDVVNKKFVEFTRACPS